MLDTQVIARRPPDDASPRSLVYLLLDEPNGERGHIHLFNPPTVLASPFARSSGAGEFRPVRGS